MTPGVQHTAAHADDEQTSVAAHAGRGVDFLSLPTAITRSGDG